MHLAMTCKGCREYLADCECGPVDAGAGDEAPEACDEETHAGYSVVNERGQVVVS